MKEVRHLHALVAWGDKALYAIGGYASRTIERFDPLENQWEILKAKLPENRDSFAAVLRVC